MPAVREVRTLPLAVSLVLQKCPMRTLSLMYGHAAEVAAGALVNTATVTGTTPAGQTFVSGADTVRVAYQAPPTAPGTLPATGADAQDLAGLVLLGVGLALRRSRPVPGLR